MFVAFGNNKCPLCGDFGTEMEKKIFHCHKCGITFNEFSLTTHMKLKYEENKFWN